LPYLSFSNPTSSEQFHVSYFVLQIFFRYRPRYVFDLPVRGSATKLGHQFQFLIVDAFVHPPEELEQEIRERYKKIYQINLPVLVKDLDTSQFRENIDQAKAMELIIFALEGVSNKYLKIFKGKPYEKIMNEMDSIIRDYEAYIDILKYGVYKFNPAGI